PSHGGSHWFDSSIAHCQGPVNTGPFSFRRSRARSHARQLVAGVPPHGGCGTFGRVRDVRWRASGAQRVTVSRHPRRRAAPERTSAAVTSGATHVIAAACLVLALGCDGGGRVGRLSFEVAALSQEGCTAASETVAT